MKQCLLIFLFLFFSFELKAQEQALFLEYSVNVINGEYCEIKNDLTSNGVRPLSLSRAYRSFDIQSAEALNGWKFNLPNILQRSHLGPASETISHDAKIIYEYDAEKRLKKILSTNFDQTVVFHWMSFDYVPLEDNTGFMCRVQTDEGQTLTYQFTNCLKGRGDQGVVLEKITRPDGTCSSYTYSQHPTSRTLLLEKCEDENGRFVSNEFYQPGLNEVGDRLVTIKESRRDFRIGRVKLQKAPIGPNNEPMVTARFFYEEGRTEVRDALNNKRVYLYSKEGRLYAKELYQGEDFVCCEKYFWVVKKGNPLLSGKLLEDANGKASVYHSYEYNEDGILVKESIVGNLTGLPKDKIIIRQDGTFIDAGIESCATHYLYENGLLVKTLKDGAETTLFRYDDKNRLIAKFSCDGDHILVRHFYAYDNNGLLTHMTIDDGSSEDAGDDQGVSEQRYVHLVLCSEGAALGMPETIEEGIVDLKTHQDIPLKLTINTYGEHGAIIGQEVRDSAGDTCVIKTSQYDLLGRCVLTTAGDTATEHTYDPNGNLCETRVTENGALVSLTMQQYDFANRLIVTESYDQDGSHQIVRARYDLLGNKIAESDQFGNETLYDYDAFGRIITVTYPTVLDTYDQAYTPTETFRYDIMHKLLECVNCNGASVQTSYNSRGQPTSVLHADGTTETHRYFLNGALQASTTRLGQTVQMEYDPLGRANLMQTFAPSGKLVSCVKNAYSAFRLTGTETEQGVFSTYLYNQFGLPSGVTVESPNITHKKEWAYTNFQELKGTREWFGAGDDDYVNIVKSKSFTELSDAAGKVLLHTEQEKKHKPEMRQSSFVNSLGQIVLLKQSVDERGILTELVFDALGRLEQKTIRTPFGIVVNETSYRYDAVGNKTRETCVVFHPRKEPVQYTTCWQYDAEGRMTAVTEAFGEAHQKTTLYRYNALGLLSEMENPDGIILHYAYNEDGHMEKLTASDGSVDYVFRYDALGQIVESRDLITNATQARTYTNSGCLASEDFGNNLKIQYEHDGLGRRTSTLLPDGSAVRHIYDAVYIREIQRLNALGEIVYSHSFDEYSLQGQLLKETLAGDLGTRECTYDCAGHCVKIENPFWKEAILLDGSQHIAQVEIEDFEGKKPSQYCYDQMGQLTKEEGLFNGEYEYDSLQNVIRVNDAEWENDSLYQLTEFEGKICLYDSNGNLTELTQGGKTLLRCQYDALNRLCELENACGEQYRYTYDAWNRRLSKTNLRTNEAVYYLYDGDKEIGSVVAGKIQELRILNPQKPSEIGANIAIELHGQVYVPFHDHRGTVCCLASLAEGLPIEYYRYNAWGQEVIYTGSGEAKTTSLNPWRFSSKRVDDETGFVYFGKRFYAPFMKRWLTKDPSGFYDGMNRFAFVHNNPLMMADAFGHASFSWKELFATLTTWFQKLLSWKDNFVSFFQDNFSFQSYAGADVDEAFEQTFGKGYLQFIGYYTQPYESGVYGYGEISDKLRVTAINGMGVVRSDLINTLELLSSSHGWVNIHYTFRPTKGWSHDIMTCALAKMGYISPYARELAAKWKVLIQEMGGTEGGGLIIHYAHSIGGTETYLATTLLTPEEKKMLRIITVGSATLIESEGFESVINYVSYRDGVSLFDPIHYFGSFTNPDSNVHFIGNALGIPLIDHFMAGITYTTLIQLLGEQFLDLLGLHAHAA